MRDGNTKPSDRKTKTRAEIRAKVLPYEREARMREIEGKAG